MSKYLSIYAGDEAISTIKEHGLKQEIVKVVAGAAGGPKWLILSAIDRFLFSEWFAKRASCLSQNPDPLFLLGSSAGAWRFAAASQNNPKKSLKNLAESYINQTYSIKPNLDEIDDECSKILSGFIDDNGIVQILNHPYCRINFLSVRSKFMGSGSDKISVLASSISVAALANLFDRKNLAHFFTRVLFYNPSDIPPFYDLESFPMIKVGLTAQNFKKALISSGSIPLVMKGVSNILDAPSGIYRDGGMIDYHLDIPFFGAANKENSSFKNKIVLFPHYIDRVVPGWLDKQLKWRSANPQNFKKVLLIAPSRKFTDMLPGKKIPERQDFKLFKKNNRKRIEQWNIALKYSEILGDELCQLFYSKNPCNTIEPIEKIL
ncbi:MAG: hypothetical protein HQK64_12535 [Desulfamplus sp.]|nr:hypothetical protein [Desulfamplus sp.]